jgi:hypothetical protein
MLKYICSFLNFAGKREFTIISKSVYNTSKLVYHDFVYSVNCFDSVDLSYDYKLERVRKIYDYCGQVIDSKIWSNIYSVKCMRNIKQTDIKVLANKKSVDLSNCDNITDVSMLGNVHTLNLC